MKFLLCSIVLTKFAIASVPSKLSLKKFLNLAQQNDINFKRIISDRTQLTFIKDEGLPSSRTLLSLDAEKGFAAGDQQDTSFVTAGISKTIVETGSQVSITQGTTDQPGREENVTSFRLEQELYRNLFGRDVRLKRDALTLQEEVIRMQVLESYETYLIEVIGKFLDFRKASIEENIAKNSLKEATKLQNIIRLKKSKRIASQTDLDRGELQVLNLQEVLINRTREAKDKWQNISPLLGDTIESIPKLSDLSDEDLYEEMSNFPSEAIKNLRTFRILDLQDSIAQKELTLAERLDDPVVKLVGGYNHDESRRFNTLVDREETVLGLRVEIPFGDTQATALENKARLKQYQVRLDRDLAKIAVETQLKSLTSELKQLEARMKVSKKRTRLVKRIIKDEQQRYNSGRVDLTDLITLRNDSLVYQLQYQKDRIDYNLAYLKWLALTDKLIEKKDSLLR